MNNIKMSLIILLLILSATVLSKDITKPFWGHHDWNSNIWTLTAKNNLTHGIICTKFGQSTTNEPAKSCSQLRYYQNHPPLISWLLTISYGIFGYHEWAGKLPIIIISSGSIILIFLIGSMLGSNWIGLMAALLALATPMFQYFGKLINHEPLVLFFSLLTFYIYLLWKKGNYKKYYVHILMSVIFIALSGWQGFFILPLLFIPAYAADKKVKIQILSFMVVFALVFLAHQLHTYLITGYWNLNLFNQLLTRIYGGSESNNDIIQFSYSKFVKQGALWTRAYYGSLLPILSVILLIKLLIIWIKTKKITEAGIILLIWGIFGAAIPAVFSQQAFIHDYLLLYILPFFTLSTSYLLYTQVKKTYIYIFWAIIILTATFYEKRGFLITTQNRDVEKKYVELAWFINDQKSYNNQNFLIESENYFNFAYPFLWNYAYGTVIGNRQDTLKSFVENETNIKNSYQSIIFIKSNPLSAELMTYLVDHYRLYETEKFIIYYLY